MPKIGVGYRSEFASWIDSRPAAIECLEITAEHLYWLTSGPLLHKLSGMYPLMVHGLGLSLGTPGPLNRSQLDLFARVVAEADPMWISEHLGFCRTDEVELGHFAPVCPNRETLGVIAEHAREVMERCGKPLILENITSHLRIPGPMSETEFLNRLCEESGCGLLLDVTNLFINSRNHRFDPSVWLREIEPERIVQLHVVGYTYDNRQWHDAHEQTIQEDLWMLIEEVMDYASAAAVIIERDSNFPHPRELEGELRRLKAIGGRSAETAPALDA